MQNLESYKPRSISRTLSVGLIIMLVLVTGLSLGVNFILSSRKAKAELETKVEEYTSALTDALKVPLWNYDEKTIAAICASYAQNEFVAKLLLENQEGAEFCKKEKVDQRLVVSRSRDIIYQGNLIGRIHIALASGYYTAVNRQLFQSVSLSILIMIGALLVMTGVLLRQFFKKPMSRFIKMVDAYAAGESDAFKQGIPYSEFRPLVDVLDEMGEKIESHMRSLELIQYAVDKSSVATYWINPDAQITYVNEAACQSLGYSKDEFVKLQFAEIDHSWPVERWPAQFEKIKSEGSSTFESVHRRKDDSTFPVEVTATFLLFNESEYIFAFAKDITQRKLAVEEIRKLNEDLERRVQERTAELKKLSEAIEHSPVSVLITDTNGTIDYVNPSFSEVTGYSTKEAIGQNPRILKSGHHPDSFYKNLWDTILSGKTWRGEFLNRKKNDDQFWESTSISAIKNDQGEITHFVAVKEDITERKRAEEAIRDSQERMSTMLETTAEGFWLDDNDFRSLDVNDAMCEILNRPREEIVGKKLYEFIDEKNIEILREQMRERIAGEKSMYEISLLRPDGTVVFCLVNASPLFDGDGNKIGSFGMFTDITDRKKIEEELRRNVDDLERFNNFANDREIKMIQLKEEINELLDQLGQGEKYKIV